MTKSMNLGKFDCATGIAQTLYTKGDLTVRTATQVDRNFIDKMQKDNAFAVGFIQSTIWDNYVFGGGATSWCLSVKRTSTWLATFC